MSVAFRRESDEEHLEPRFERPIPPGPNLVTARGLALIEQRAAELEAALRDASTADAKAEIARDLRYWHTRRATAELVPPAASDEVTFGSRVRFRHDGQVRTVEIVGHDEADASAGRIAYSAPLARALMGTAAGEFAAFAGKADAIEVLDQGATA